MKRTFAFCSLFKTDFLYLSYILHLYICLVSHAVIEVKSHSIYMPIIQDYCDYKEVCVEVVQTVIQFNN